MEIWEVDFLYDNMDINNQKKDNPEKLEIWYWNKLQQGDTNAIGPLYDLFVDILFSHGMCIDKNKGHVMDCIHDLFLDLYKYRAKLSKTDNVKYYLLKSLRRKINRKYKKKYDTIKLEANQFNKGLVKNYTLSVEEELIKKERVEEDRIKLQKALSGLTLKQKKSLYLRFNQERSYEEIADIMEVSIETARTTIYRALKSLRKYPFLLVLCTKILFF